MNTEPTEKETPESLRAMAEDDDQAAVARRKKGKHEVAQAYKASAAKLRARADERERSAGKPTAGTWPMQYSQLDREAREVWEEIRLTPRQLAEERAAQSFVIAELEERLADAEEGLRGCCLLLDFDPSDGEGTSPQEVVDMVKAHINALTRERDALKTQVAEARAQVEKDKYAREEWATIIKKWAELCTSHDALLVALERLETALRKIVDAPSWTWAEEMRAVAREALADARKEPK